MPAGTLTRARRTSAPLPSTALAAHAEDFRAAIVEEIALAGMTRHCDQGA
jgi:hypothetical protein